MAGLMVKAMWRTQLSISKVMKWRPVHKHDNLDSEFFILEETKMVQIGFIISGITLWNVTLTYILNMTPLQPAPVASLY